MADNQDQKDVATQTDEEQKGTQEQGQEQKIETKLPTTQEELDDLIEERVSRERKQLKAKQKQSAPKDQSTAQESSATDTSVQNAELDKARKDLTATKAQLEAIKLDIKPDMAEDAVYLAIRALEKDEEDIDDDSMRDALKNVLKKHPEWKKDDQTKSGFKVGAPGKEESATNKTLPKGKVIF